MPRGPMDEREKHGLQRKVVPREVERRRPQQHAARADPPFEKRRRATVETRQHLRVGRRHHRAIAVDPRRGKVAAARRAERLEYGVAVFERANRGPRRLVSDPRAPAVSQAACRRPELQVARDPIATNSPPPAFHEPLPVVGPSAAGTAMSFSTTTDARRRSSSERASWSRETVSKRGASPIASARVRYRRSAAGAAAIDDDHANRLNGRHDEMKYVVGGKGIIAGSHACRA